MRQQTGSSKEPVEKVVKNRRATRKHYSAEEKIRTVLEGLRGEDSIAELCRRRGIDMTASSRSPPTADRYRQERNADHDCHKDCRVRDRQRAVTPVMSEPCAPILAPIHPQPAFVFSITSIIRNAAKRPTNGSIARSTRSIGDASSAEQVPGFEPATQGIDREREPVHALYLEIRKSPMEALAVARRDQRRDRLVGIIGIAARIGHTLDKGIGRGSNRLLVQQPIEQHAAPCNRGLDHDERPPRHNTRSASRKKTMGNSM